MKKKKIIHRDIKPENILLTEESTNATLKITDMGLSRIYDPENYLEITHCGTPLYSSPEIIN